MRNSSHSSPQNSPSKCGKAHQASAWTHQQKLNHYQNIIKDLRRDNFDENSKVTNSFLSKFTCADLLPLIVSFIRDEVPGEGQNTWSLWARLHPPHNEVEWATIWTFWLLQFLPEHLKGWEEVDGWKDSAPPGLLSK